MRLKEKLIFFRQKKVCGREPNLKFEIFQILDRLLRGKRWLSSSGDGDSVIPFYVLDKVLNISAYLV